MKFAKRIAFLLLAAAAAPCGAFAADYEPPIIIDEAPEVVPVEVGSGWYLRGDISYNVTRSVYDYDYSFPGVDADNMRFGGSVGVGYHFTDYLRSDVNIAYIGEDAINYGDALISAELKNRQWATMANLYVDLGTVAGFTPYVGVGAGALFSNASADVWSGGMQTFGWDDSQAQFAYSAGAGIAYQLTKNVSVDVGYQYFNSPDTQYIDPESLTVKEGIDYHQVKVGLRYDLW